MLQNLLDRYAVLFAPFVLAALFVTLAKFFALDELIVVLNGILAGSLCAIVVAYWQLIMNAVIGNPPYDRVRQMTLGFFLSWIAIALAIFTSAKIRAEGAPVTSEYTSAVMRYVAIIAAWLQVTAPDFGLGIFHGRDRKVLYGAIIVGTAAAISVIGAQRWQVLS